MWAVTAGPLGFSTAWLVFSPTGMSFDDYIRHERPNGPSRLGRCVPGGAIPPATHLPYLDLLQVDIRSGQGPSAGRLANFVAASRLSKWLRCCWAVPRFGPYYSQLDAYRQILRTGRLRMGNRHPLQRLKRWYLRRRLQTLAIIGLETTSTASDGEPAAAPS
jgi:hypothetical protein